MRIGELAEALGTTPRTIRYYEELGLLAPASDRDHGAHRTYDDADLERMRLTLRLRDLLGVTLEELKDIVEAEAARPALRAEFEQTESDERRREILAGAFANVNRQLDLVRQRMEQLEELESELAIRRRRLRLALRAHGEIPA